jgi:hypothetical protein
VTEVTIPVAVFESKDDNRPIRFDLSWESLADRLCRYDERPTKDGRAWSPVTYRPGTTRGKDNVEQVHALVLDIDHNELPTHLLNGLEYVAHTTFSHSESDPRWRVVLPLTRPVEGEDWPNFWLRANAYFGGCVDPQTKDRSRIFYLPSCLPGALHETKQHHGLLLDPSSLPEVPQYQPPELTSRRNGTIYTVANDGLIQWAQRFAAAKLDELAAMPPNSGRNSACNRVAFMLAGLVADGRHGLDTSWVEQQLFDACQRNNLVFEDGERSVRVTINSGITAGVGRPWSPADRDDNWTPSPQLVVNGHVVDPVTGEVLEDRPEGRFRFLSAAEIKNRPAPEYVIKDVLQQNTIAMLVGAQETYKSFVGLDMAMCTAAGLPWAGHPTQQGVTAYISAEGGSGLKQRITAWEIAHGQPVEHCYFLADQAPQFLDRKQGGDVDELLKAIALLPEVPNQIYVDTLARTMVGGDENSAQDMGLFIASAEQIRQATGATVTLVHHNNRQGSARGSSALLGAVHTIIECSREKNSPTVVVRCGKQKDAEHFESMMFSAKQITVDNEGRSSLVMEHHTLQQLQVTAPNVSPSSETAFYALKALGEATFAAWRDASGLAHSSFRNARRELVDAGLVDHIEDQYTISDVGHMFRSIGSKTGSLDPMDPGSEERVQKRALKGGPFGPSDGPSSDPLFEESRVHPEIEEGWA